MRLFGGRETTIPTSEPATSKGAGAARRMGRRASRDLGTAGPVNSAGDHPYHNSVFSDFSKKIDFSPTTGHFANYILLGKEARRNGERKPNDKAKPSARVGRKAMDLLREAARLPNGKHLKLVSFTSSHW